MLIIADDIVQNVVIPRAEWIFLREGQGLVDVKSYMEPDNFGDQRFKVIILIMGQAEAAAGYPMVANCVQAALTSVEKAYPQAVVMLCSPLPRPRDGPEVLKDMDSLGDIMFKICAENEKYEYARLGLYFYGKYRLASDNSRRRNRSVYLVNPELIHTQGLTYEGVQSVQRKIQDKLNTAGLYDRYTMLNQRLIDL